MLKYAFKTNKDFWEVTNSLYSDWYKSSKACHVGEQLGWRKIDKDDGGFCFWHQKLNMVQDLMNMEP